MIKNMTRKGLAIGTTAALTLAGLVGVAAPASATTGITVEPSKGTSYTMISGEQFDLRVFGQANYSGSFSALRWEITNPDTATVNLRVPADANALAATRPASNPTVPGASSALAKFVVAPLAATTATGGNQLGLSVANTVATTLQVRAFVDVNGNGTFESATDLSANVANVVFVKPADVTATASITAPVEGDTTVTASVEFTSINNEQLDPAKVAAHFTKGDGTALTVANVASTNVALTGNVATLTTAAHGFVVGQRVTVRGLTTTALNGTHTLTAATTPTMTFALTNANITSVADATGTVSASTLSDSAWSATNKFQYTATAATALIKNQSVKVQPMFNGANVGVAGTATIASRVTNAITASVVKSATAGAAGQPLQVLNRGTFAVKALVEDASTPAKPVAGQAVTAKVETNATLSSTVTLTIGSTTYTNVNQLPGATNVARLAAGTTGANGEVSLNIATAGTADGNTVTVTFYVENRSSAVTATLKDAVYSGYIANANGDTVATTDGAAAAVNVVVLDQFGGAAPAGYKATAVFNSARAGYSAQATAASTAATSTEVTLVNGRGTLNILDNGTGNGTNTYDIGFNTGVVGAATTLLDLDGAGAEGWLKVKIVPAVNSAVGSFTVTDGTTALALNTAGTELVMTAGQRGATNTLLPLQTVNAGTAVTFKNFDARAERGGAAPNVIADDDANRATLAGTVSSQFSPSVAAATVPNASVTFSGSGLLFEAVQNGSDVFGKDSLTINTDGAGAYSVKVYSQKVGKSLVTITSGSVSRVVALNTAVASAISGDSWVAPATVNVEQGRSFSVSATLVDRFGNAVDTNQGAGVGTTLSAVSISWNGPVLTVPTTLPTETGTDGVIRFGVVPGSADVGTYTAIFTYGGADGVVGTGGDDKSVTVTVNIGAAAAAKTAYFTKRAGDKIQIVSQGSAKVRFMLNGKRVATRSSLGTLNRTFDLANGKNVIEIYVDGKRVLRRAATK